MRGDNETERCGRECLGGGMVGKAPKRMWHVSRDLKGAHHVGIWGKWEQHVQRP